MLKTPPLRPILRPVMASVLHNGPGLLNIFALGQSNIDNQFHYDGAAGQWATIRAIGEALPQYNIHGSVQYVNGANGGSRLLKTTYTYGGATDGDYWVDDTDPMNLAAGPLVAEALLLLAGQGLAPQDVHYIVWSQGEAEATAIYEEEVTELMYSDGMEWLFAHFESLFANLRGIGIQIIGTHGDVGRTGGYQAVRNVQHDFIANRDDTFFLSEIYDQRRSDPVHIGGHYDTVGDRNGRSIAVLEGADIAAVGPVVSNVAFDGYDKFTMTIAHDKGTTLNGYTGTPVDVSPDVNPEWSDAPKTSFFQALDANGHALDTHSVFVTGASQVQVIVYPPPTGAVTYYGGYDEMYYLDYTQIVRDNSAAALPLRSFKWGSTFTPATPAGDFLIQQFAIQLAAAASSGTATLSSTSTSLTTLHSNGSRATASDSAGGSRDFMGRRTLTSATQATLTRQQAAAGTADIIFRGVAVQWPSNMVDSIQVGFVDLTGSTTSGTATISSVDLTRSIVYRVDLSASNSTAPNLLHHVTLTNATTVTVQSGALSTTVTRRIAFCVIQFKTGVVASIQDVTLTFATNTTRTDTSITPVNPGRTIVFDRGHIGANSAITTFSANLATKRLFARDTVRMRRGDVSGLILTGKCTVVEFNGGFVSVDRGETNIPALATSATEYASPAPTAASWLNYLGFKTSDTGSADESASYCTAEITDASTITVRRGGGGSNTTDVSWERVTFVQ